MPPWLTPYPGANAATQMSSPALVETSYTTSVRPEVVIARYRQLFEAAGVRFNSNFDGSGTSIRGAAAECDLLIKVREGGEGRGARVSCATKSGVPFACGCW